MYKYKVLLINTNMAFTHDFFNVLGSEYCVVSCSPRNDDIENHIRFFTPDIMLVSLGDDVDEDATRIMELRKMLERNAIVLGIFGTPKNCADFQMASANMALAEIHRPLSIERIDAEIEQAMKKRKFPEPKAAPALKTKAAPKAAAAPAPVPVTMKEAAPDGKKRILIIDDNPMMIRVVREYLGDDYEIASAISGKIAYKFLEKKQVDLILMDYEMPVENGAEVLRNLRKSADTADIPVIFITGTADSSKIREVLSLRPQGYVLKPVDRDQLMELLGRIWGETT